MRCQKECTLSSQAPRHGALKRVYWCKVGVKLICEQLLDSREVERLYFVGVESKRCRLDQEFEGVNVLFLQTPRVRILSKIETEGVRASKGGDSIYQEVLGPQKFTDAH